MDACLAIKQRLQTLGLEQKDLTLMWCHRRNRQQTSRHRDRVTPVRGEFLLKPRLACERAHDNGHANDTISRSRRR